MHGPDGTDYANENVFAEIEAPHKLVVQHESEPHFRLTISLAPSEAGTLLSWSQAFESAEVASLSCHATSSAQSVSGKRGEGRRWCRTEVRPTTMVARQ